MILTDIVAVIADDLTGANDTALQFHKQGAKTKILLELNSDSSNMDETQVWAVSSESRNTQAKDSITKVEQIINILDNNFSFDYYYKKIDSTLRGHIALETLTVLNILDYDAAIIVPAFPQEGRITVGGYHLAKGIPIGKTEMAIDPHSPITESYLPLLLASQLGTECADIIGTIDLRTVLNGAGPILIKINELINAGKRLIIADATALTDIEQIALAINKCDKKLLPTGTAALAQAMSKYWLAGIEKKENKITLEKLPKFIVSGTATQITANQIKKLEESDDFENINFIPLSVKNILDGVNNEIINRIITNLQSSISVCVHTSNLLNEFDGFSEDSFNAELTKDKLANMITDYLGELTYQVLSKIKVLLITLGGETSYKCCKAMHAFELALVDEISTAISLCKDNNSNWIITKSGNLGNTNTIIEILNYLECHE